MLSHIRAGRLTHIGRQYIFVRVRWCRQVHWQIMDYTIMCSQLMQQAALFFHDLILACITSVSNVQHIIESSGNASVTVCSIAAYPRYTADMDIVG